MAFDPEKITYFAKTDARGKNVAFGIKAKDRQRHVYVIGKTGMGKSTLLENMAVQDIQNGEGLAFIDPHGSAAETLLKYIPEHRINDVLYFAPFDTQNPVAFNVMEDVGPDKRHLVVSGLMSVFKKIWVDAWSARMEYILQNTILALLEYPGSTLLGVNRMLSDKAYRELVVANIKDPSVRAFWVDEFAKYNERYMQEAGDAIKNKIGQFTANPVIRNIVGQAHSSFDIRKMMDEKKILIVNLSKGLIGESNANLLGSMLTTRIYLAAMSRADLSPDVMKGMPNFYFYVDEFQSFANATFANILSEARKYHLNLTIAHQYIEQMEEEVRSAVFGNVGTIISFRVGPFDAEILETIFTPQFLAADIVNLGFAQIYLTLMIDGIGSAPFSATTTLTPDPPQISYRDMAIAQSRRQFTRIRSEVEAEIIKFHEPVVVPRKTPPQEGTPQRTQQKEGMQTPRREREGERKPQVQVRSQTQSRSHQQRPEGERKVTTEQQRPTQETRVEKLPPSRTQHPEQNPEELRAILKRLAQKESPRTEAHAEKKEPTSENRHELKNILNTVAAQNQKKEVTMEAKVLASNTSQPQPQPQQSVSQSAPQTPSLTSRKASTISPKELERMMRITVHDKPPL